MSPDSELRPPDDSWVVALYSSEHDVHPSGSGLVIDRKRILTCAHVARSIQDSGCEIWVAFPKSKKGPVPRLRVAREHVVFADSGAEVQDLAVLHSPESVPPGVDPVPLRDPASASLLSRRWWAFGFPQGHPAGNAARGTVGEVLANGLLRIDRRSRYGIESGFSGAGVWSPEYRAVVAVVTEAENRRGDGQAIPLNHLKACFPGGQMTDLTGHWSAVEAGDVALSAWGWSLTGDPEAERHWSPRARGVTSNDEHGYRFRGRTAALQVIKGWLGRDRDRDHRRMLVVTGAPGAGKSAVLGRVVTTADADAVGQLPASDTAVRAALGSVACAVHAKGKTALEVATEIARAASAELPDDLEDFPRVLHAALIGQDRSFNVIIDALDEAVSLSEARNIIRKVLLPMTETFSDVDARVVAGSRRAGTTGDLLGRYRESSRLVDLDDPEFFAQEDLAAYALATLQLAGDERPENEEGEGRKPSPYADARVAGPVAARIAELSAGNFLVAGLTARTCGMTDDTPKSPDQISFSPRISDVIDEYLELIPEVADIDARDLLTALAFAESPGLPVSLWRKAIRALGYGNVTEVQLARFTQTRAANFLIESSDQDGHATVFRLFHQALNDALLNADEPGTVRPAEEEALTRAFMSIGRDGGWERAPAYLLRSLPAHAARAGLVDDLLADDSYLLHADLRRLILAADGASTMAARDRARLLRLTPEAVAVDEPDERVAMFSVTEALDNLGNTYRSGHWQAPYRARWAVARPRTERASFNHQGAVRAMCAITVDDQKLLATSSDDCTVRLWEPRTGEQLSTFGERNFLYSRMCVVTVDGRELLATSDYDRTVATNAYGGTVRLWNPRTGEQLTALDAYISGMCGVTVDHRELLATIDKVGGPVRLWDPRTGEQLSTFGKGISLCAVCAVTVDGRELLATGAEYDRWARVWDPRTGEQLAALDGGSRRVREGSRGVRAMCSVTVDGQSVLATCSHDSWVRLWDPRTGDQLAVLNERPGGVGAMCSVTVDGQSLLATGGTAGTVHLWDPRTGRHLTTLGGPRSGRHGSFDDSIHAMCSVTVDGQSLLATGSDDGTVRLWDPQEREQPAASDGHYYEINAMCAVTVDGRELLATGGGAVRLRDPHTGEQLSEFSDHLHGTHAVCAVTVEGRNLLATRDWDGWVHLRDPGNGEYLSVFAIPGSTAMCAVTVDSRNLLVTGGDYGGTVRIWDPLISERLAAERLWNPRISKPLAYVWRCLLRVFRVRRRVPLWPQHISKPVTVLGEGRAVCVVTVDGQDLLVAGGRDGTVRIWDPRTSEELMAFGDRKGKIHAVCAIMVDGQTLLATGNDDGLVQLWDPRTRKCLVTIPAHHPVSAVAAVGDSLAIAFSFGILVIKLNVAAQPPSLGRRAR